MRRLFSLICTIAFCCPAFADYYNSKKQVEQYRQAEADEQEAREIAQWNHKINVANAKFAACHGGVAGGSTASSDFDTQDGWDCKVQYGELDCANVNLKQEFRISWPIDVKGEIRWIGDAKAALRCFTKRYN